MTTTVYLLRHATSAPDPDIPEPDWPLSPACRRETFTEERPLITEIPVERICDYVSHFPGIQPEMVLASIVERNNAGRLWSQDDALFLLWDQGNNVFYLTGDRSTDTAELSRLIQDPIRDSAIAEHLVYFKVCPLSPGLEEIPPTLFPRIPLHPTTKLFYTLPPAVRVGDDSGRSFPGEDAGGKGSRGGANGVAEACRARGQIRDWETPGGVVPDPTSAESTVYYLPIDRTLLARSDLAQNHRVWTITRGQRPAPEGAIPLIADHLGVELTIEEIPVDQHLRQHPEAAPFLCHRIYDLSKLKASGARVPSTPIEQGLREHVDSLLA